MPLQEDDTELLLQLPDLRAERGLGDIQMFRCPGHAAQLDDAGEVPELPK